MRRSLILLILTALSLPGYAGGGPQFPGELSIYAGIVSPYMPPVDHGLISSSLNVSLPLGLFHPDLSRYQGSFSWEATRSLFYYRTRPFVDQLGLHVARSQWMVWEIALAPLVGTTLTINRVADNAGMSIDSGVVADWTPLRFLKLYSPAVVKLYRDGFGLSWKVGVRPYLPAIYSGLDLGFGVSLLSSYNFDTVATDLRFELALGGGSRYE